MGAPNVSGSNPGPNAAALPQTILSQQTSTSAPFSYTFGSLPPANSVPSGTIYYTSDQMAVVNNGSTWVPLSSSPRAKLITRLRAGIGASLGGQNPAQRAPLLAPPTWQASTNYSSGQVITNTGAGAGNLYICQSYGQTAAATGPTGQGAAFITDNATSWQYFGPVMTATSQTIAPVVSGAAVSSAPANSWYYPNAADTLNAAATANTGFFTYEGGYWQNLTPGFNSYNSIVNYTQLGGGTQTANVGGIQSSFWNNGHGGSVSFYTDAIKIMISSYSNNGNACFVEVDDVMLSDTYFLAGSGSNGVVLDWTTVGGRKTRKIRVYCDQLHGVSVMDGVSQVWATAPAPYSIAFTGDSISQGSGNGPFGSGNYDAARRFARMIGCDSVCNNGVGGSGFVQMSNGIYNYQASAQLFSILNPSPDVVFVAGNVNDVASYSSAQRQAAILAYLTYVRGILPNAMIVVFGPWGSSLNASVALRAAEADLNTVITAFSDSNVFFIPLIARPSGQPWILGTGRTQAPTGVGNADIYVGADGVHPICMAHKEYIPRVYAEAFKNMIASLPY